MKTFIHGIALENYRGIGPKRQYIAPLSELNLFIGANNAGKSIVLNFIADYLRTCSSNAFADAVTKAGESFVGAESHLPYYCLAIPHAVFEESVLNAGNGRGLDVTNLQMLKGLSKDLSSNSFIWGLNENSKFTPPSQLELMQYHKGLPWGGISKALTNTWGGAELEDISRVVQFTFRCQNLRIPETHLIPAKRQIGNEVGDVSLDGGNLVPWLLEIQTPDVDQLQDRELFEKINAFLQTVIGKKDARIRIPHTVEHVLVEMDGKTLPLKALGTGIHEVVLIAAHCTRISQSIVCIEEPEIHLHPVLQRKLIRYLSKETDNQYFIATHSAAFIDTPEASIFHVANDGDQTYVHQVSLKEDKRRLCRDLGYKASDIVQANAVIWVEGPSDRIYLKHWIAAVDSTLQEGVDFSIMFYGGRNLSHLSGDSEVPYDLVELRALNQNSSVILDSDRSKPQDKLNATKKRIIDEFSNGGIAWVTKGREVENYVPHNLLQQKVAEVHSKSYDKAWAGGPHDHALYYVKIDKEDGKGVPEEERVKKDAIDKVEIARRVSQEPAVLDILDLRKRVTELVEFIRAARL